MEIPKEIIEQYLTNNLSLSEREAFETQLASNADLKNETEIQSAIIESIKKVRVAQLKANLSAIKIKSTPFISTQGKVAASMTIIGGAILLFYLFTSDKQLATTLIKEPALENLSEQAKPSLEQKIDKPISAGSDKVIANKVINSVQSAEAKSTRIPVQPIDPREEELESNSTSEQSSVSVERSKISPVSISTEIDSSDKKYTFHYKFHNGKLILYGSFDKSLYEILEINGENRAVFLFYKDNYYLLDETQTKVKMLEAIQDKILIERLNEYRLSKK
jgi:hypothetical protein